MEKSSSEWSWLLLADWLLIVLVALLAKEGICALFLWPLPDDEQSGEWLSTEFLWLRVSWDGGDLLSCWHPHRDCTTTCFGTWLDITLTSPLSPRQLGAGSSVQGTTRPALVVRRGSGCCSGGYSPVSKSTWLLWLSSWKSHSLSSVDTLGLWSSPFVSGSKDRIPSTTSYVNYVSV